MRGFCVMYTYDVALDEEWDNNYTASRSQHSDSGEFIYVAGRRSGCYKYFYSVGAMLEWCYENGWTKPEESELQCA